MKIILYTHSDYLDIYALQQDNIEKLNIKAENIIIFSNKYNDLYKYKTYLYDDNKLYSQKLLECLSQIEEKENYKYFLFFHDNDIIMSYNETILEQIKDVMIKNNIDRVPLYKTYIQENTDIIDIIDDVKIKRNTVSYLFSVNPTIWKLETYSDILLNCCYSYRDIEHPATDYIKQKNYKVYNIHSDNFDLTYSGFTYKSCFSSIHITTYGCIYIDNISPLKNYVLEMKEKYNIQRNFKYTN